MAGQIKLEGFDDMLKMLNRFPREVKSEFRQAAKRIAADVAEEARFNALKSGSPQLQALSETIKARADRVPVIVAGGARRVTSSGAPARDFFGGSEFGAIGSNYLQFPRRKQGGYSIYPAIHAQQDKILNEYFEAVEEVFYGKG